jgi:TolA-binding protein
MMPLRLIFPAAVLLSTSACFATRNDVRILQGDIFALRTQQARADSARAQQLAQIASALTTNLATVRDSIHDVSTRLTSLQGATRQELYSLGQQLVQLGALMGQSETVLRNFSATLEERNRQLMEQAVRSVNPSPAAVDSTRPATTSTSTPPPTGPTEGPYVLYQIGRDMLADRAWAAARESFNKLIVDFPSSDRVPYALSGIGQSFDNEGNRQEADSVYRLVVQRFPTSDAAATSLYKLGLSVNRQGRKAEARTIMQQVVKDYPRSDESKLAADWLANNPL